MREPQVQTEKCVTTSARRERTACEEQEVTKKPDPARCGACAVPLRQHEKHYCEKCSAGDRLHKALADFFAALREEVRR
jgi:hypothetical protein